MTLPTLVAGAAVLWAAALPAAAYAAGAAGRHVLSQAFAVAVYGLGAAVCHQQAARSFHLFAVQLPVCARCTGLYAGAALVGVATAILGWRGVAADVPHTARGARALIVVAALPLAATLVWEWTTGRVPSHAVRAATGVLAGGAVAHLILHGLRRRA